MIPHRHDSWSRAAALAGLLLFACPARGEDAHGQHGDPTAAESVRQAGEAARRAAEGATPHGDTRHEPTPAKSVSQTSTNPGASRQDEAAHGSSQDGDQATAPQHESDDAGHGDNHAADASHGKKSAEGGDAEAAHHGGEEDGAHAEAADDHGEAQKHPEKPPQQGPQPYQVIRSLQFLQDQAARGNVSANRVQARLLQWYGPVFERAGKDVWKDPRNQRAAALFVLSGGPPSVLRLILAKNDFPDEIRPLLDGALAYVENRQKDAETLLGALDTTKMEPGLAAQINLAVAQMQEKTSPDKALERLRRVMLDASGTLLEEAALRLAMALADQLGEHDQADGYARLYFDRYSASIYAGNFRARFTAIYVERPAEEAEHTVALLADAVARIPLADRLNIYLSIGRRSLVAGNMKLAGMAGAKVLEVENLSAPARQRALLYVSASTLTEGDTAETLASLRTIEREGLHPADRKLYDAALGVLDQIRKPLMTGFLPDTKTATQETTEAALDTAVIDRATKLLEAVRSDTEGMDK